MTSVRTTLQPSKMFFTSPVSRCETSAMVWTMPSPGFGIRRMSRDAAAPTPVQTIAARSTSSLPAIEAKKDPCTRSVIIGMAASKTFISLVKAIDSGSCRMSFAMVDAI